MLHGTAIFRASPPSRGARAGGATLGMSLKAAAGRGRPRKVRCRLSEPRRRDGHGDGEGVDRAIPAPGAAEMATKAPGVSVTSRCPPTHGRRWPHLIFHPRGAAAGLSGGTAAPTHLPQHGESDRRIYWGCARRQRTSPPQARLADRRPRAQSSAQRQKTPFGKGLTANMGPPPTPQGGRASPAWKGRESGATRTCPVLDESGC